MRMRKGLIAIILAAALLSAAAWQWSQRTEETRVAMSTRDTRASTTERAPAPVPDPAPAPTSPAASSPQVSEHEARMDFHDRVRTFFAQAPAMSQQDKAAQAQTIDREIERYQDAGELSAAEAFTLRLALIRESVPESEQRSRIEQLRDAYRARDARLSPTQSDPMFEVYKAREQEIVARVQAMEEFPDGLTRDEYLRHALQREREALLEN